MSKINWQHCQIVGCDCKRKKPSGRDGEFEAMETEWICRGHWSMAAKHRRTFYLRVRRRFKQMCMPSSVHVDRKLWRVYNYLWDRLKREITEKAMGL